MSTSRGLVAIAVLSSLFVTMALALALSWPRPWFGIECQIRGGSIVEHRPDLGGQWCEQQRGTLLHYTREGDPIR